MQQKPDEHQRTEDNGQNSLPRVPRSGTAGFGHALGRRLHRSRRRAARRLVRRNRNLLFLPETLIYV